MYAEHNTGEKELYDLEKDPFELQSRHNDPAYASVKAAAREPSAPARELCGRELPAARRGPLALGAPPSHGEVRIQTS